MTVQDLRACLNMTLTNYGREADENTIMLWTGLYIGLDGDMFKEACLKIMRENAFFPNAKEILGAYRETRDERKRLDLADQQQKLLEGSQAKCHLCASDGFCLYEKDGYEYFSRCICGRGVDLNRYSEAQIKHDVIPDISGEKFSKHHAGSNGDREKIAVRKGKNPYYIPSIKERLAGDFPLYEAEKKEGAVSGYALTDGQKMQKLREMQGAFADDCGLSLPFSGGH